MVQRKRETKSQKKTSTKPLISNEGEHQNALQQLAELGLETEFDPVDKKYEFFKSKTVQHKLDEQKFHLYGDVDEMKQSILAQLNADFGKDKPMCIIQTPKYITIKCKYSGCSFQ